MMRYLNARNARRRVENFALLIDPSHVESETNASHAKRAHERFFERLDDDLDAPSALAAFFSYIRDQNRSDETPGASAQALLNDVNELFDAFDIAERKNDDQEIEVELARRRQLRKKRRFADADAIRDRLRKGGVMIQDTPDGTRWWVAES